MEFVAPKTAVVSTNVRVDEDGYIAQDDDDAVGTKAFSLQGLKTNATYAETKTVLDAFVKGIAQGDYNQKSTTKTVVYTVGEED